MSTFVIKYGGSLLDDPSHREGFLRDVAALAKNHRLILVHGGGKEISRRMEQAGLKPKFVGGRRYTDASAMSVVDEALAGLNQAIVSQLQKFGVPAVGLSGQEEHLMVADPVEELGRVGIPKRVEVKVLEELLARKALPVYYSVALDAQGGPLNINADDFALAVATALHAERLVFLTDTGGVLDEKGHLIPSISPKDVETLASRKVITGGMLIKAQACIDALHRGVGRVDVVKGIRYLLDSKIQPEGTVFTYE